MVWWDLGQTAETTVAFSCWLIICCVDWRELVGKSPFATVIPGSPLSTDRLRCALETICRHIYGCLSALTGSSLSPGQLREGGSSAQFRPHRLGRLIHCDRLSHRTPLLKQEDIWRVIDLDTRSGRVTTISSKDGQWDARQFPALACLNK